MTRPPVIEGEVIPPPIKSLGDGNKHAVTKRVQLSTLQDTRREMAEVYRLARGGKIRIEEASRLCYMLDRISQAIRAEKELDAMQAAYAEAFTGLTVRLAPPRKPRGDCDATD